MIEKVPVKRRTVNVEEGSLRKNETLKYHFVVKGEKMQVCQKMFINTLDLTKWTIRYWISGDKYCGNSSLEETSSSGHGSKIKCQ